MKANFPIPANLPAHELQLFYIVRRALQKGIGIDDNMDAQIVEVSLTHEVPKLLANPLRGRPKGFIPIRAYDASNADVQVQVSVDTLRTDNQIELTAQYDLRHGECHVSLMRTTDQSIPDSTLTPIEYDSLYVPILGTAATWDVSDPSKITILEAGVYDITAAATWESTGTTNTAMSLLNNGSAIARQWIYKNGLSTEEIATSAKLAVGDYLQIAMYEASGGAMLVLGDTDPLVNFRVSRFWSLEAPTNTVVGIVWGS